MVCYMIHLYLYDLDKDVYCSHIFQERDELRNVSRARANAVIHPTKPIAFCLLDLIYRGGNSSRAIARTFRFRFGDEGHSPFQRIQYDRDNPEITRVDPTVERTEIGGDYDFSFRSCVLTLSVNTGLRSKFDVSADGLVCCSVEILHRHGACLVFENACTGDRLATLRICQDWNHVSVGAAQIEGDTMHLIVNAIPNKIMWHLIVPRSKLLKVKRRQIALLSQDQLGRSSLKIIQPKNSQEQLRIACYGFMLIRWIEMGDLDLSKPNLHPEVVQIPNECLGAWEESDDIVSEVTEPIEGSRFYDSGMPGVALLEQQKHRANGSDPELFRW